MSVRPQHRCRDAARPHGVTPSPLTAPHRRWWPLLLLLAACVGEPYARGDDEAASATSRSTVQAAPSIASSSPAIGAREVDPATTEIRVTFDQDMHSSGYSWTGDGKLYPEVTGRPRWDGRRSCVLPVDLEPGRAYRVGINSSSHRNFRSVGGTPAASQVIWFTTQGASEEAYQQLQPPVVLSLAPPQGATDLPGGTHTLQVTFDRPMSKGFSWVTLGDDYPGGESKPRWSKGGTVCTLAVELEPGQSYRVGLNSSRYTNFTNKAGVPLEPVVWTFSTAAAP